MTEQVRKCALNRPECPPEGCLCVFDVETVALYEEVPVDEFLDVHREVFKLANDAVYWEELLKKVQEVGPKGLLQQERDFIAEYREAASVDDVGAAYTQRGYVSAVKAYLKKLGLEFGREALEMQTLFPEEDMFDVANEIIDTLEKEFPNFTV